MEKARVVQFFLWVERYDEGDSRTHTTGLPMIGNKQALDLYKLSAAKFLAYWELPKSAISMVVRGMALRSAAPRALKKMRAIELVRRLQRYKDAYSTFPHMTTPYVYPVGGFGGTLSKATTRVVEANGGACCLDTSVDDLITNADGSCGGVSVRGVDIEADCVVAAPEVVPQPAAPGYTMVRLYAVLAHPPNLCKEASSCQVILPGEHCGRTHDIYLTSFSSGHGVVPKGKWLAVATARVEGETDGLSALAVAKRELASVLPLLKPARKMLAEVVPHLEADGAPERLLVLDSNDETSYLDSVEGEVTEVFERITGEPPTLVRR